jgi:nucleotide-binding universal stress UspA family protein
MRGISFAPRHDTILSARYSTMIALKNVLVATDFSEPSEVALAYGRSLARTFGATLHILHVAERVRANAGVEYFAASVPNMQAGIEDVAWRQLDALLIPADRVDPHVQLAVRIWASPAPAIVEYAEEAEIDLIVIGTHGRDGFSRFLMGSVAQRVVRMAPCPVLTVRHPEREFLPADDLAAAATSWIAAS